MTFWKRQYYEDSKNFDQWLPGVEGRREGMNNRAPRIFKAVKIL